AAGDFANGQLTGAGVVPVPGAGPAGQPGFITNNPVRTVGTGSNFTSPISGGLKVGFVSSEVSVFVSALESVTNTTVLANPTVLALNKQRGEVLVGREDGYLTTTVTDTTTV